MVYGTINVDSVVSSDGTTAGGLYGFKNRIINGAMLIDQRNAGAEINPALNNSYCLDRWNTVSQVSGKFKVKQNAGSVTPPTGFINYLGCNSLSAYTVGSSEAFNIRQLVEGYNTADLAWGTANAATVTLSFWVYSSLTGTFGGSIANYTQDRSYPFSYTINSANTWEQKSITIAGDTTGSWPTDNTVGIRVNFSLGTGATLSNTAGTWAAGNYRSATGAVSVVGTNGATWYVTGVQLEKGSTATSFDYRPYGTELALCQRYYQRFSYSSSNTPVWVAHAYASNSVACPIKLTQTMRAIPTSDFSAASTFSVNHSTASVACSSASINNGSVDTIEVLFGLATTPLTQNWATRAYFNNSSAYLGFTAEL